MSLSLIPLSIYAVKFRFHAKWMTKSCKIIKTRKYCSRSSPRVKRKSSVMKKYSFRQPVPEMGFSGSKLNFAKSQEWEFQDGS